MAEQAASGFGTVKVNTEELKTKGEDAWQKIREYQAVLEQMEQAVNASSAYWSGKAGDTYSKVLKLQMQEVQEALEAYSSYPKELLEYAGIYSEVIAQTESAADSVLTLDMF